MVKHMRPKPIEIRDIPGLGLVGLYRVIDLPNDPSYLRSNCLGKEKNTEERRNHLWAKHSPLHRGAGSAIRYDETDECLVLESELDKVCEPANRRITPADKEAGQGIVNVKPFKIDRTCIAAFGWDPENLG